MLFSIQFGSSRKVAVAPWLFKADAVVCCTTLNVCLSSYIGWQMENPVNCVKKASVLEPKHSLLDGLSRTLASNTDIVAD